MRHFTLTACASLACLLTACGTPADGYYDSNGNYIPYNRYNREAHDHAPLPGGPHPDYNDYDYHYDRAGYYDYNGYYINNGPSVPRGLLPPPGMCRVWFTDRAIVDEPPIENCDGIRYRVPAGAYVIYGG